MKQRKECDWEPFPGFLVVNKSQERGNRRADRNSGTGRTSWRRLQRGGVRNGCALQEGCATRPASLPMHVPGARCVRRSTCKLVLAPPLHPRHRRANTSLQARCPLSDSHLPPPAVTVPSALQPHPAPLSHVRPRSSREGTVQGTWTSHLFTSCKTRAGRTRALSTDWLRFVHLNTIGFDFADRFMGGGVCWFETWWKTRDCWMGTFKDTKEAEGRSFATITFLSNDLKGFSKKKKSTGALCLLCAAAVFHLWTARCVPTRAESMRAHVQSVYLCEQRAGPPSHSHSTEMKTKLQENEIS